MLIHNVVLCKKVGVPPGAVTLPVNLCHPPSDTDSGRFWVSGAARPSRMILRDDVSLESDEVPYPRASCFLHYYENLVSVLRILSSEIGIELDHIDPREVLRGSRRSVSNLLEIITAFILHCVRGNLLDFEDVPHSAETFKKDRVIEESPLGIDLSHSPELPRSVGRVYTAPPCVRNLTDCSPTLTKSTYDSGLPRTFATGDTVTQLSRVTRISSDTQSLFASGKADVVTKQHTPSPGSHYPRLPSILSMQLPVSPPTTPKDADNIMEIVRTISCRAHDEAQAVAQLVNAIGLQCSTASKIISQCNSGCMIDREKPSVCSPEVQDTLYRILMGVNILLHNQLLDSALLEQEQGKEFPTTGRKARKLPPRTRATHDARLRQVALRRATIPLDCSSDSEFNELIGIKHKWAFCSFYYIEIPGKPS
ncbi:cement precursor protein 3B variant 1 [Clonorchis sinensis]|uniref:Cement protein 3B variant 1 n=1 Tax=Clonorchis sinensis TaxID=79923 RepID=G7Y4H7_CLOSI|nr:cement precursor protein 3B variant 1 [Clonorchis sinensis]